MQSFAASARPAASLRLAAPRQRPMRAAPRSLSVCVRSNLVSDVGKYLSEAASRIFHPQADDVPWEKGSQAFAGKIVHHEEAARLRALELAVDSAVADIKKSMDEAPEEGEAPPESEVGEYVLSSIKRVFGNNFKGDETEPKKWISTGYQGRSRSQRSLRREYDRLTRFQSVVKQVKQDVEANKEALKDVEAAAKDM